MIEIISVRFKNGGKQYYFNPNGARFREGDGVIVETAKGAEYCVCTQGNTMIDEIELTAPLRPVVRAATEEDRANLEKNREKERRAFAVCRQKIAEHGLEMKLVSAECSFEGNKFLFFFTSEGRVDFRALVKDLAGALHARIELRQIGVRDEAKLLGGLGICGKPFCCSQFLSEFQPVSIKMAKTQNLSLNPTKISGTCGRLMCCLKYEQEAYEDLVKRAPKQDSFVETPDGAGTVSSVNLLRQTAQVRLESAPETPKCYQNCELCVIRSGKGRRPEGYVQPPLEELAKLRRPAEEPGPENGWGGEEEENSLGAAVEAVLSRRDGGEATDRPARRGGERRREPGTGQKRPQKPAQPQEFQENRAAPSGDGAGEKRPYRRRRRRPRGNGGGTGPN